MHKTLVSRVNLTMQSLLESLHTDHVLCEFERLAFCLDGERSVEKNKTLTNCAGNDKTTTSSGSRQVLYGWK